MFFAIGFFLLLGGLAMLVLGGFTLPNGRSVAKRPARQMGGVFVSYVPILILVRLVMKWIFEEGVVNPNIVYALLTLMVLITGLVIFLRSLAPPPRATPISAPKPVPNPFVDPPAEQPQAKPNPFDFR